MNNIEMLYVRLLQSYPKLVSLCSLLGLFIVCSRALKTLFFIYKNFLRRGRNLTARYGDKSWVLITGSSDGMLTVYSGIGRAFAHSFAKRGFNIILSARTESKLVKVQQQLRAINPTIQVRIIQIDFSESSKPGFFDRVTETVRDLDISVLVNNVGVDVLSLYHELTEQEISKLITINCFPISILCRRFIPRLLNRGKKSAIINVASVAGELPIALHNVYSASKAFDDFLSRSLSYEYPELDIICLRPSEVSTPMTFNKKKDILTIGPEESAEGLLRDLSYERTSNGPVSHKLQSLIYSVLPEGLFNYVFKNFIGPDFIQERKAAIEKMTKKHE